MDDERSWRNHPAWSEIGYWLASGIAIVAGVTMFIAVLTITLLVVQAIFGDDSGPEAWIVVGPAFVIGTALVYGAFNGTRGLLERWTARRYR